MNKGKNHVGESRRINFLLIYVLVALIFIAIAVLLDSIN